MLKAGLAVQRHGIMEPGPDAGVLEMGFQPVAIRRADHEQMIDMVLAYRLGQLQRKTSQRRHVTPRQLPARFCPSVEMLEFLAQDQTLDAFHSIVESELGMDVALTLRV